MCVCVMLSERPSEAYACMHTHVHVCVY